MSGNVIFEVQTPLGFLVRCTQSYWTFIVTEKHPSLLGNENEVKQALSCPDEIRRSRKDPNVYLFYQGTKTLADMRSSAKTRRVWIFNHRLSRGLDQSRRNNMEKIKVIHDVVGHTLTVWLDDPKKEHIAEETTEEVVLMKDKSGKVIGFEVLNYESSTNASDSSGLAVETIVKTGT